MDFTAQFPILTSCSYLNTASSGILSKSLLEWRNHHDLEFYTTGSAFRNNQADFLQEVRATVSGFFGAGIRHTFLTPNFSFGFNTFLSGLPASSRFLLLQEDYPSVNYAVESHGFSTAYLPVNQYLEERIIEKINQFQPSVFAFSLVQYTTGRKLSLEFIKKLKGMFPDVLLVADGTQYCGTESFNFEQSGLDVLIASGYKWMLAGYGNGFCLLKDQAATLLYPQAHKKSFPKESFLKDKEILSFYFEPGHQDTFAFGSLYHSINDLQKIGMAVIEENIRKISQQAKTAFAERGLLEPDIKMASRHSSIFNLNIPDKAYNNLLENKVICIPRGKGIRISFHFYNTQEDLEKLLYFIDK
ncbi:aminotransferase class V-fold PLP-dependent enzyme [Pedobacter sp. AW31-3R]|uniref:aminotransferase class V-fold PLP-dependent enzyme n=1 Tax=Pedobacter sp. AW31-3R TaxID=3445781 RepID=UPI003F9F6BAB